MGYMLLEAPYCRHQIEGIQNIAGSVSGIISVDLSDIIDNDFEGLMDIFEQKLVSEGILSDISYKVVGTGIGDEVHIYVDAEVELF